MEEITTARQAGEPRYGVRQIGQIHWVVDRQPDGGEMVLCYADREAAERRAALLNVEDLDLAQHSASDSSTASEVRRPGTAHISLQCHATDQGVKALLTEVLRLLPHAAPPPPPRKGSAWIEGYETAATLARDILDEIRANLRVVP